MKAPGTDAVRKFSQGLGTRAPTGRKAASAGRRERAPFRRTFDTAAAAAERFYSRNIDFLQPILDSGEPREAVREWLRSNAHGRTGRMKVRDLSQTPWAKKMLASPEPVKAALRNVFGHASGRRWDRVDWDAIRSLGETLVEFASEGAGAGAGGWTWYPIALEDDDAKILDRLSVDGDTDAYRRFAASLSAQEVQDVVARYAGEVKRLAACMPAHRRRVVEARINEIRQWQADGIPEHVCGQRVYAGHTCDLEPLHGELQRLREACESDSAFAAWRNESVRRSPRTGSVAEGEVDDVPVELVPTHAFEGEAPGASESCSPSEAARVMGRLGVAKRRENAAKRRKTREVNAAARKAERERVSEARKAQRDAGKQKAVRKAQGDAGTRKTVPTERASTSSVPTRGRARAQLLTPAALGYEERLAIGGTARDKTLFRKHGSSRIGTLVEKYIDGTISGEENRELEALGFAKGDVLTDDGWVLYQSIKGRGNPKAAPATSTTGEWTLGQSRHEGMTSGLRVLATYIADNSGGKLSAGAAKDALRAVAGAPSLSYSGGESVSLPTRSEAPATKAAGPVPVLEVFDASVMGEVQPKHVAKAIKLLVEKEGLLPPGYSLSARTPREGVVYLSARTRGQKNSAAVTERMRRLFPEFRDGLGQSELHLVPRSWDGAERLKTISSKYADTLRVLALREAGVKTEEATPLDEPAPVVNDGPVRMAEPKKCGAQWCAEVVGEVRVGDPLRVVTRRGKQWDAVVTEVVRTFTKKARVLKTGGLRSVVRSRKLPPAVLRGGPDVDGAAAPKTGGAASTPKRAGAGRLRFFGRDADSKDRRMDWKDGIAVLEGKPPPPWAIYVFAYPKERKFRYVRGSGEPRAEVYGLRGLEPHLSEALRRLRRDRDAGALAEDEEAMLEALSGFHARIQVPRKPERGAQGSLVTPEQEGFALTHPRGTAAVHGASAGTGGTQSVLPGVSRKVSRAKLTQMKARERARRAPARSSDTSRMTTARLQALLFELEGRPGLEGWSKAKQDAYFESIAAVTDELFARGMFEPVRSGSEGATANERPLESMSAEEVDNAFRGKDPSFAAPRWLVTNVAYALEARFESGGLTLVRGPLGKTSARAESLYVLRKGVLLGDRGRRARVTVRRHGGYYTAEIEGMPKQVADWVESAVGEVMRDPKLGLRDQGGGLSWRRG